MRLGGGNGATAGGETVEALARVAVVGAGHLGDPAVIEKLADRTVQGRRPELYGPKVVLSTSLAIA